MKTYFALGYNPIYELKIYDKDHLPTVLSSYYTLREIKQEKIIEGIKDRDAFLDSGAFTAMTKKIEINLDEYIQFIKDTLEYWKVYAVLDVIGDPEKTRKNQEYMESKGLKPLPTFHYKSPPDELRRLIKEYDYIALGGLVPLALQKKKLQDWLDFCFSIIKTDCKVHGFGVNSIWAWKRYPFYSVDATSWIQGMKFGRMIQADDLNPTVLKNEKALFYNKARGWDFRNKLNIEAYNKLAKSITELWEKRGVKWE